MAYFFHRGKPGFCGCEFRLVYKATSEKVNSFKLSHYNDEHCHIVQDGIDRHKDESSVCLWKKHSSQDIQPYPAKNISTIKSIKQTLAKVKRQ